MCVKGGGWQQTCSRSFFLWKQKDLVGKNFSVFWLVSLLTRLNHYTVWTECFGQIEFNVQINRWNWICSVKLPLNSDRVVWREEEPLAKKNKILVIKKLKSTTTATKKEKWRDQVGAKRMYVCLCMWRKFPRPEETQTVYFLTTGFKIKLTF